LPKQRRHKPVEAYSKLYYAEKVRPLVAAEKERLHLSKADSFKTVKRLTQQAFDAEPEELRREIEQELAESELEKKSLPDGSPQSYAKYVLSICLALSFVHNYRS
jgi:hypothetical protein